MTTKPAPKVAPAADNAASVAALAAEMNVSLAVETNLSVEDNTDADDLPEEAAVTEAEVVLTSGLTLVTYE